MTNIKIINNQHEIQRCKYCGDPCGNWCCQDCFDLFEADSAYPVDEEEAEDDE